MILELPAAAKLLAPVAKAAAPMILKALNSQLNPTEIEKALQAGLITAHTQEDKQPQGQNLFFKCYPDGPNSFDKLLRQFFEQPGVQEELQRPLKHEGVPKEAFLCKALEQLAADRGIELIQSRVEPWLSTFIAAYFERTSTYLRFQVAKETYCKQIVHYFDDVRFAGISVEGQEIEQAEKLADIFVMPDLQAEQLIRSALEIETPLAALASPQAELLREQRQLSRMRKDQPTGQRISANQLLSQPQTKRVVMLGAPGSGKTTLMSYFAVMLAQHQAETLGLATDVDWLPILIRIRDLAKHPDLSILDYVRKTMATDWAVNDLPSGFFEYWLNEGRALILLDGLDEVVDETKRYRVVEKIETFLGTGTQNWSIITSRPAGYKRDFFRTEEFPHYQILPFDDSKIEQFINHWYDSRFKVQAEAQRRKDSLRRALAENDRIKLLARNPLLLTIIALIHRYQAVLPRERYKLYDKAVNTLLTTWDANKELSDHQVLQYLGLDDLRRLMERLAYWIHTQGGTGDDEGGTLIDRDELIIQLSQYIQEQKKIERHCASAEAERFLEQVIRDRAGLLSKQGQNCYAFVHKTFQEYLAAQEVRDRQEEGFEVVLEHIRKHLHDPHWREVLLLLIAQQKRSNPTKAIQEILKQPTPHEQWLHRNLFFAASCMAEDVSILEESLVDNILSQLVDLEVSNSSLVSSNIHRQVSRSLRNLSETNFQSQALKQLKAVADSASDQVRFQSHLAVLGEQNEAIIALLATFKDNDNDSDINLSAAFALRELGNTSEELTNALLEMLRDKDSKVGYRAVLTLGRLGNISREVIDALLEMLKDKDSKVSYRSALTLGQLGNTSREVIDALLEMLKDKDSKVSSRAALTLGQLGNTSREVIDALLEMLKDKDSKVSSRAALTLRQLGNTSKEVTDALLEMLRDKDSEVSSRAALTLGRLGNISREVIDALLEMLKDKDSKVSYRSALILGQLGNTSKEVTDALLEMLRDKDSEVSSRAAFTLGQLGNISKEVTDTLLEMLRDKDSKVSYRSALTLGQLGSASREVIDALLEMLKDKDSKVSYRSALTLGQLGNTSKEVTDALLEMLRDKDSEVSSRAALTLGQLGNTSKGATDALLEMLRDKDSEVSSRAAFTLGRLGNTSKEVTDTLLNMLKEENSIAVSTLYELGKIHVHVIDSIVLWIEQHKSSRYVSNGVDVLWALFTDLPFATDDF
jgi:HEAT repeat protein/energy-coupling factor transporter ATP-binding protein EcfA2